MITAVPIGTTHHCTVQGAVEKSELCEHCGTKFVYQLHRTATGQAVNLLWLDKKGAVETAREYAINTLQKRFDRDFEIVPCPRCGHVQNKMLRLLRSYMVKAAGLILFILSIPSVIL